MTHATEQRAEVAAALGQIERPGGPVEELFRLTDRLFRAESLEEVYEAALDAITATLNCRRASILVFDDAGIMQFVASRGLSKAYRTALSGHTPWKPGQRDAHLISVPDISESNEADWIKKTILAEGIVGLGFIPLFVKGGVAGKFMLYYPEAHDLGSHETGMALMIARQVGFSLERFRAEHERQIAEDHLRESEQRFRLMADQAPVMIWLCDAKGECTHLNKMLREFWRGDEDAPDVFDWRDTIHPDDVAHIHAGMQDALTQRKEVTLRGRYRDHKGRYRCLETQAKPRFSAGGTFLGMIGVNTDVTEREEAQQALQMSEERFRLAVEAAPSAMILFDAARAIVSINANAEKLFGYDRQELEGRSIDELLSRHFHEAQLGLRDGSTTFSPLAPEQMTFALRKDGVEVPVEIALSPIETSAGTMTIASVVDITERVRTNALRETLLAELNHRVKNTLSIVQSVAYQTFRHGDVHLRKAFEGRLAALGIAHNLLTQNNWNNTSLMQIVGDVTTILGENRKRVFVHGPFITVSPQKALAISMAFHELLTNSLKYGALSSEQGMVALTWELPASSWNKVRMVWSESGGPPVSPPKRAGFGSLLLEKTLSRDLEGDVTLAFRPEGVKCEITALLTKAKETGTWVL